MYVCMYIDVNMYLAIQRVSPNSLGQSSLQFLDVDPQDGFNLADGQSAAFATLQEEKDRTHSASPGALDFLCRIW